MPLDIHKITMAVSLRMRLEYKISFFISLLPACFVASFTSQVFQLFSNHSLPPYLFLIRLRLFILSLW